MIITATYNDATTAVVTGYDLFPATPLTTSNRTVTISYTEDGATVTTAVNITVEPPLLRSIAVTTQPAKTVYAIGETFDPAGMVVTATYSDGSAAAVTDYTTAPTAALTVSDTAITISYTENAVTKTATVNITVKAGKVNYLGQSKIIRRLCEAVNGLYSTPCLFVDAEGYISVEYSGGA